MLKTPIAVTKVGMFSIMVCISPIGMAKGIYRTCLFFHKLQCDKLSTREDAFEKKRVSRII
jgi:predicted cation transporter